MTDRRSDEAVNWPKQSPLSRWALHGILGLRPWVAPEVRRELLGELFSSGDQWRPFVFRFSVLVVLSTIIAAFGILSDSPAVVIGAMLVAPLMTPVLGVAASIVMVWPGRFIQASLVLGIASVAAVAIAFGVSAIAGDRSLQLFPPSELTARTHPTIIDLGIALAAGAAGAYVLVRKEAMAAIPGVAVAVALLPPLAAIGIALELGREDLADNALLLYLTNLSAIVAASTIVFIATGFVPDVRLKRMFPLVAVGVAITLLLTVVIAQALGTRGQSVAQEADGNKAVVTAVDEWLEGSQLNVVRLEVDGGQIVLDVTGPDRPPKVKTLANDLADRLGQDVHLSVRWTERQEFDVEVKNPD